MRVNGYTALALFLRRALSKGLERSQYMQFIYEVIKNWEWLPDGCCDMVNETKKCEAVKTSLCYMTERIL